MYLTSYLKLCFTISNSYIIISIQSEYKKSADLHRMQVSIKRNLAFECKTVYATNELIYLLLKAKNVYSFACAYLASRILYIYCKLLILHLN